MGNQVVSTPRNFLLAVEHRFGPITWDLAATSSNCVTQDGRFFGPGSTHSANAFLKPWRYLGHMAWLNPPFADIASWARHSAEQCAKHGQRIALLAPAAVCTNYFIDWIKPNAYVFELTPRVFDVEIRDCILALFESARYIGRETWKWKTTT